jgi:hypothetical protein
MIKFILQLLNEVKGLLLLLLTLLMSALFLVMKNGNQDPYPYFCNDDLPWARWCFSEVKLSRDTFWYFLFEETILLIIALYIYTEVKKHRAALAVFVFIQVIDILDYLISYQKTWMYIGPYPLSWNILKVVVFSLAIMNEVFLLLEKKWSA